MRVKYVDGYKIRQTFDVDFNVIHFNNPDRTFYDSKWYIPEGEIWLDSQYKEEEEFLKTILLSGLSDREEIKKQFCQKSSTPDFIVKEEDQDDLKIQYVNGKIVRKYIDPEFVFGGHDLVYTYVPKKTIWLDNCMDPRDVPHTLVHEVYERELMMSGKSYDVAHEYALVREKESRREAGGIYIGDPDYPDKFDIKNYYLQ